MSISEEAREEIEAIRSIYPDFFKVLSWASATHDDDNDNGGPAGRGPPTEEDLSSFALRIPANEEDSDPSAPNLYLDLNVFVPPEYPSSACLLFELDGSAWPFLGQTQIAKLESDLLEAYTGDVVLFTWVEIIRTLLKDVFPPGSAPPKPQPSKSNPKTPEKQAPLENTRHQFAFKWAITDPMVVQKSTFIGYALSVQTLIEIKKAMADLVEDRDIARATHRIMAYRLVTPEGKVKEDRDDDGEEGASRFLASMLSQAGCANVLVVVVRWYGGVLLGPMRFRVITQCGRDALLKGGLIPGKK